MKKILISASALSLMAVAAPSYAQDGLIELEATVVAACGTGNHRSGGEPAAGYNFGSPLTVDLGNGGNGQFDGQEFLNQSFGNLWCNGPANVTFEIDPLQGDEPVGSDTGSFTNLFDIRVTTGTGVYFGEAADWAPETSGAAFSLTRPIGHAFETGSGTYGAAQKIEVLADSANRRAVAGAYEGAIRFTASVN